ncbi:MAG: DUF126 domain-containing protein [Candidatus Lokiarchaeota archaeon]|nr:DUF126 domain-containing protein [Candidatus Lokiarchaeota archaeon]MBD3201827.1 DUF126 domain-containing protein [Candidatus Lokiarchaeota archaeon]
MRLKGDMIVPGNVKGITVISLDPISFLGDIDPETGIIVAEKHSLKGESIKNKIFVFSTGKGSTVGSYVLYQLYKNGCSPAGIVNKEAEAIVAVGAIISEIPMIHHVEITKIPHNKEVILNADDGFIEFE